jgi:hypothetical protein
MVYEVLLRRIALVSESIDVDKKTTHYMEYIGCSLILWIPGSVLFVSNYLRPILLWIFFIHFGVAALLGITSITEKYLEKKYQRPFKLAKKVFILSISVLIVAKLSKFLF